MTEEEKKNINENAESVENVENEEQEITEDQTNENTDHVSDVEKSEEIQVEEVNSETQAEAEEENIPAASEQPVAGISETTEGPVNEIQPEESAAAENETPVAETEKAEEPVAEADVAEEKAGPVTVSGNGDNSGFDDFDWDAFEEGAIEVSKSEQSKFEERYNETLSTIAENEVTDGTVISMNKREVVINIGYKSEGVVSLNEFRYNPDLKPGDTVEVYVESKEDKKGQLVLSHKKARAMRSWDRVNQALDQDEVIKGYIKCRTKGGMIVDVFGIEAFLPGSQIDVKPIRDYDAYVGKNMEFKVVKINHEFKNVVVSHKALIEEELEQQKKEIIAKLEKGQVLEGTVKNITSYGVFIDLGGVDGLIHITDLSWGRVNHPEEIVQLDQKLNVVILDFDDDKKTNRPGSETTYPASMGFPR